jgi:bacteriocin-like protein
MTNTQQAPAKDDKHDKTAQKDHAGKPAQATDQLGAGGQLSDEELQSIAGGPTMVERRP